MAMESQSPELEDLAMLVILAARVPGVGRDLDAELKDAGGQRWKEWIREKKRDPDVGPFLKEAYPYDE